MYCERVEKRANKTLKLVNNDDYDMCKEWDQDKKYSNVIDMMDKRYTNVKDELGTSACAKVVDAFLTNVKASDADYDMCKMVTKNVDMALEHSRYLHHYAGKCDGDKKDVSRTDYGEKKKKGYRKPNCRFVVGTGYVGDC